MAPDMEEAVKRLIRALPASQKPQKTMGRSSEKVHFDSITQVHKGDALRALVVKPSRFSNCSLFETVQLQFRSECELSNSLKRQYECPSFHHHFKGHC